MIDCHCHLEQKDYDKDRNEIVEKCRKELKAVITSCAHPKDFELTMNLTEKYKNFVFVAFGIHPEYINEVSEEEIEEFIEKVRKNKDKITAIGETGLDYSYIQETEQKERQKELFVRLINLSKELRKPLIIHCRDAFEDVMEILEREDAKDVDMHMFGKHNLVNRVMENGWYISMNAIVLRSKSYGKVIRDCSLDRLMLETDAPWLSPKKLIEGVEERNDPTSIRLVAEKIADIKKVSFEEIWKKCGENAIRFFKLTL